MPNERKYDKNYVRVGTTVKGIIGISEYLEIVYQEKE